MSATMKLHLDTSSLERKEILPHEVLYELFGLSQKIYPPSISLESFTKSNNFLMD